MQKNEYQAELFKNRITKRYKHLLKWSKNESIFAFRLYDKDIPEIPLAVDLYFEHNSNNLYAVLFLYKRPYKKDLTEEQKWIKLIEKALSQVLNIPAKRIFFKVREKQKGLTQYKKIDSTKTEIIVKEGQVLFFVNLSDYLDTGLFLDHRTTRLKIFKEAKEKRVLNLYAYTGTFSIHALAGAAKNVCSVDLSNTYLHIAKENLKLNKLDEKKTVFEKSCVIKFLKESINKNKKWDLIICDPPTFSNSKQAGTFDINRDWKKLCMLCLKVLATNGILYFSSNSLKLKFNSEELNQELNQKLKIEDISLKSIPKDFRNKKIHKMWEIKFLNEK